MPTTKNGPWPAIGSDGRTYQIVQYITTPKPVRSFEGTAVPIGPAMGELKTTTGLDVNWIAKGEYQIVSTGVRLRSSDPGAP